MEKLSLVILTFMFVNIVFSFPTRKQKLEQEDDYSTTHGFHRFEDDITTTVKNNQTTESSSTSAPSTTETTTLGTTTRKEGPEENADVGKQESNTETGKY